MLSKVKSAIEKYGMLNGVTEVTVALSGGADSVALLDCLNRLSDEFGFKLYAAHLNHSLRGEESDSDEAFVRNLCKSRNIQLFCEKQDVMAYAKGNSMSVEFAAREVRYDFLKRVAKGTVATAHTASDNIETVLLNLTRGTGLAGLAGIPPKRGVFIRPLIGVTRSEVEEYCRQNGLQYCVDSTNSDQNYSRNRIRLSVIPELLKINSAAVKNASKMSEILRADSEYLNLVTAGSLKKARLNDGLSTKVLQSFHIAVRSRCIARYYEEKLNKVPEYIHVEAVNSLVEAEYGKVSVQNCFSAVVKNGVLYLVPEQDEELSEFFIESLPFEVDNIKFELISKEKAKNHLKFNSLLLNNVLDYDKICGKLVLRGRKPSDKISLAKRNCTKSLKKLLNEAKIPEHKRDRLLVLADDRGVIWLEGFGADKKVAVTENTDNILFVNSGFEG